MIIPMTNNTTTVEIKIKNIALVGLMKILRSNSFELPGVKYTMSWELGIIGFQEWEAF